MGKLFTLWGGLVVTILISVPVIAAIIEISHQAAKITYVNNHGVVAVVILVAGYGLIWKTFTTLDKVAGQIGNLTSSVTGRARKALSDYRGNTMKKRLGEAVEGKRNVRGAGWAVGLARRAEMADQGGFNLSRRGRARYRAAEATHLQRTAAKMVKDDEGRAGGDDDAMELAMQEGMSARRFEREYRNRLMARGIGRQEATRRASATVGKLQTSLGAEIGTDAMRVAAYKSLLNSKTSYQNQTGTDVGAQDAWERMMEDGNSLMADGLMTSTDVVAAIKQRSDRADRAGVGWGTLENQVERSFGRYQTGARRGAAGSTGPLVTTGEARGMSNEALFGTGPGGVVGGRHEAVSALSGAMRSNVEHTLTNLNTAQAAHASAVAAGAPAAVINQAQQQVAQAQEQFDRELAAIAGRYDAMGQISPQNATIMANNVMSQTVAGGPVHPPTILNAQGQAVANPRAGEAMTIQEMVESARGRQGFLEMRREYMSAATAQAAQQGQQQPVVNPSDRRIKRNIEPISTFNGIQLYRFQYLWSDQVYVGVMAQDLLETHPHAVVTNEYGFYGVNYGALGTKMYTIEEWEETHATAAIR
jgi:hypothetical protein